MNSCAYIDHGLAVLTPTSMAIVKMLKGRRVVKEYWLERRSYTGTVNVRDRLEKQDMFKIACTCEVDSPHGPE